MEKLGVKYTHKRANSYGALEAYYQFKKKLRMTELGVVVLDSTSNSKPAMLRAFVVGL